MFGSVFCIAAAVLGVDIGWQPNAQGELEYVIQLPPEMAEGMFAGRPIEFDLRPEHQGVRHFRIQVGKEKVPREGGLLAPPREQTASKATPPPSDQKLPEKPPENPPVAEKVPPAPAAPPASEPPTAVKLPGFPASGPTKRSPASTADTAPNVLRLDPDVRPLGERPASYAEPDKPMQRTSGNAPSLGDKPETLAPLLIAWGTAAGLLAALVYLGWVHVGTRRRYQALLVDYCAAVGSLPGGGVAGAERSVAPV
jgi:hypothetical protein